MTSAEVQAILTAIHGQIDGRPGEIYSISISGGLTPKTFVTVSWDAFKDAFGSQQGKKDGRVWTKEVNGITYTSKQTVTGSETTIPS